MRSASTSTRASGTSGVPTRRARSVQYRLTRPDDESTPRSTEIPESGELGEEDYTEFLQGVFGIALVMFFAQALGSIAIANYLGVTISLRAALYVFPYIEILATGGQIIDITTMSTALTATVVVLRVLFGLIFRRSQLQTIDGRATGLLMVGVLVILQYARHVLSHPVIDTWVLAQVTAGVIAATVIYLGFRPEVPPSAHAERRVRPTRIERSNPSTHATRTRKNRST